MQSWSDYFELSQHRPPNPLLQSAADLVVDRKVALDLGAGSLKDSKYLLDRGFQKVVAIEQDPACKKYRDKIPAHRLSIRTTFFEAMKLKPHSFNLITAQFSLPFTSPPHLPRIMDQIINSLQPAGIFCGQFFGPQDGWNIPGHSFTFVSRRKLLSWFTNLQLLHFKEEQFDAATIDGQPKHWHLFHVIALKPPLK